LSSNHQFWSDCNHYLLIWGAVKCTRIQGSDYHWRRRFMRGRYRNCRPLLSHGNCNIDCSLFLSQEISNTLDLPDTLLAALYLTLIFILVIHHNLNFFLFNDWCLLHALTRPLEYDILSLYHRRTRSFHVYLITRL